MNEEKSILAHPLNRTLQRTDILLTTFREKVRIVVSTVQDIDSI